MGGHRCTPYILPLHPYTTLALKFYGDPSLYGPQRVMSSQAPVMSLDSISHSRVIVSPDCRLLKIPSACHSRGQRRGAPLLRAWLPGPGYTRRTIWDPSVTRPHRHQGYRYVPWPCCPFHQRIRSHCPCEQVCTQVTTQSLPVWEH